ncbi:hypothetical protein J21TS7_07770 [Paenibacillus cineris]|uniref:Uncharacterized protein n=1 Tax=Paenibacillus cineris TaxID=237530 RepID=A0ABQ4L785_9BACL|nr:hypothetical protein J21TS7_07770 [Paenibacillus cineris]
MDNTAPALYNEENIFRNNLTEDGPRLAGSFSREVSIQASILMLTDFVRRKDTGEGRVQDEFHANGSVYTK